MAIIKNVVHPGWVISINDGDRHFITGTQLIQLYGLNPRETAIADNERGAHYPNDTKHYYPDGRGNYGKGK